MNHRSVFSFLLTFVIFLNNYSLCYIGKIGIRYEPTKGEVWPKPQYQDSFPNQMIVKPESLKFEITGSTCKILQDGIDRYNNILRKQGSFRERRTSGRRLKNSRRSEIQRMSDLPILRTLDVELLEKCDDAALPELYMNEKYTLNITEQGTSSLRSNTVWGILRGLETFSQLVYVNSPITKELVINGTFINDFPRFTHRGLLVDTGRHYITVRNILKILDGMSYNKLNVFHWHIVDDESFPYVSPRFPELSEKAAFYPSYVYSQSDIAKVIEYARVRGIRVMSEYDSPGHTRSWGGAFPRLLTTCYGKDGTPNGDLGLINPTDEYVYDFLKDLFTEVVSVFPDKYVHLGGDEADFDCWESNPDITKYMTQRNISTYQDLEEMYIQRLVDIVDQLNAIPLVWQEVYANGVKLPKGTVVQVWKDDRRAMDWIKNITAEGHPALLSWGWYLDHLSTGGDWTKFYNVDPHSFPGTAAQKKLVLGGEASMWTETVDNNNVLTRIFPRTCATAEKLWSAQNVNNVTEARYRLEEHYCRMNKRGLPAQPPNGPGFCDIIL